MPKLKGPIDDVLLHYSKGIIYLGIAMSNIPEAKGKKPDLPDSIHLQKYDNDLKFNGSIILKDVGNTHGSSMIFQEGIFNVVSSSRHWDDSSLIVARYNENLDPIDRKIISTVPDANEEFPMGSLFENGLYFVCYQHITGSLSQPIIGEPVRRVDVMLNVFDSDWKLLDRILVTEDSSASTLMSHTRAPHLALAGNRIYVSYGADKVFVKEYELSYE